MNVDRHTNRPDNSLKVSQGVQPVLKYAGKAGWKLGIFIIVIIVAAGELSRSTATMIRAPTKVADALSHGKYIVEHVAMCVECHTPRNQRGELIASEYLRGAAIPVAAPRFGSAQIKWAVQAPAIAGLTGYDNKQGVRLLMEGITRDGRFPDPPMPRFRLNRTDAEAVVEYLKSIP